MPRVIPVPSWSAGPTFAPSAPFSRRFVTDPPPWRWRAGAAPTDVIVACTAGSAAPGGAGPGPPAGPTKASGFVPDAVTDSEYAPGPICTVSFATALVTA